MVRNTIINDASACCPNSEPFATSTNKPAKKAVPKLNSLGTLIARNINKSSIQFGLYSFKNSGIGIIINNRHTIDELNFVKVDQKSSNWYIDKTTKRAFMELDGSNETV